MKKESVKSLILLIVVILTLNFVNAHVGVRPALIETNFEPGGSLFVNYYVDTTSDVHINISAFGDFAEYVTFNKNSFDGSGGFMATVNLPQEAKKPGTNRLYIKARQIPKEGVGVGTAVSVGALIKIYVPYPGKYADIQLTANSVNYGDLFEPEVEVMSRGKEKILASTYLELYANEKLLDTFNLGVEELESGQKKVFKTKIDTNKYSPGLYTAKAIVTYGNLPEEQAVDEREFRIGELNIEIINYTKEIIEKKVNPFFVDVISDWKNPINDVYANITISNGSRQNLLSFLTSPVTIKGFADYKMGGFIDAQILGEGEYDMNIKLHYQGSKTEEETTLSVIKEKGKGISKTTIYISIVAAIIIIFMIIIYVLLRKLKKKK